MCYKVSSSQPALTEPLVNHRTVSGDRGPKTAPYGVWSLLMSKGDCCTRPGEECWSCSRGGRGENPKSQLWRKRPFKRRWEGANLIRRLEPRLKARKGLRRKTSLGSDLIFYPIWGLKKKKKAQKAKNGVEMALKCPGLSRSLLTSFGSGFTQLSGTRREDLPCHSQVLQHWGSVGLWTVFL